MFFVRNHDLVDELLKKYCGDKTPNIKKEQDVSQKPFVSNGKKPFRNGHSVPSYIEPENTSNDLSKDKSHASNEIEKRMIEIWTALVGHDKEKIGLTRKRIAFLKQAFKDKFESCLEKWKKYCQDIASSRFLMGEIKSSFRATLDWALKFDIIQKILEGNYGIGDRNPSPASSACESFVKNSKIELTSEEETIQTLGNEPEHVRAFRLKWLNKFGASNYRDCLKDCTIEVGDGATLILRPSSRYNAKSIASYWTPTLLMGGPFVRVHIFQQEGDLVFDKWFGTEQSREGVSPENEGVEVKGCLDLTAAPISQSLPETTEVVNVDAAIEKLPEEVQAFGDAESGGDIPVTPETQMLRKKLRQALPPNYFPTWLGSIEVEGISQDGKIVVTLEDSLAVGWCRSRFSKEIFQSVASLWNGVNRLVIREKEGDATQSSIENPSKKPENVEEKSTFEQAIRSLLMVANQPQTCPLMKTVKTLGMQGACQALGRMG